MSEIADKLRNKFNDLGITTECSKPFGNVIDGWPGIGYRVIFTRGNRSFSTEYHLGIGHVDWTKKNLPVLEKITPEMECMYFTKQRKPLAKMKDTTTEAHLAAILAKAQKVQPNPAEVLGNVCQDGISARDETFENWAANFGYDEDSRKAERIYRKCLEGYQKALSILSPKEAEEFAELAQQL